MRSLLKAAVAYSKTRSWRCSRLRSILSFILQVRRQAQRNKHEAAMCFSLDASFITAAVSSTAAILSILPATQGQNVLMVVCDLLA